MGSTKPFPTRLLMEALIWQTRRGGISKQAKLPCSIPVEVYGTEWPDYGFDEWFLQTALYPRVAFGGLLTFVPVGAKSELLPLDIEYTMWANPSSEIQYFGWADGRAGEAIRSKHRPVKVREDCAVVLPRSVGKLKSQAKEEWSILFDDPAPPVIAANRDWIATLESAVEQGKTKWLAVIMEGFEPSMRGAELFLERRLEDCDAAHSGYAFAMMTPEVVAWARRQKLDSLVWQQGQPVKYPKLSGPLTLWRRSFLRALLKEWNASGMAVPLEMFLAGWAEKGRAKLVNTSSAAQGWKAVRATSSK